MTTDRSFVAEGRSSVQVGGIHLETLWLPAGIDDDLTWVLLHEGLGCIDLWRNFPAVLAEHTGNGVFVWSRQGYGRSDGIVLPRPLDYMTREATGPLGALLERVPGNRIALLGHSDGGSIAALYAGLVSDPRLAGVVLVAPHFYTEQIAIDAIAEARLAYDNGELRVRLKKYHHENVDCAFRGWNDAWLDPGFLEWDIRHSLPGMSVPMVLVQGDKDKYGSDAQLHCGESLCTVPCETRLIPGCDHWPHLEAPDALIDACDLLKKMAL